MKNLFIIIALISIIFTSCKKENDTVVNNGKEYDTEKALDIRGEWRLVSAYMYFQIQAKDDFNNIKTVYRKKDHFGGGRTESTLLDGGGNQYPIEYIELNDIWTFENDGFTITRTNGTTDMIYLSPSNLHYNEYPVFEYYTNPTTGLTGGDNNDYYYHVLGVTSGHRDIELIIKDKNEIRLILSPRNMPSYNVGEYNIGRAFNELYLIRVN